MTRQLDRIEHKLDALLRGERYIFEELNDMANEMEDLKAQVAREETVGDSLVTLVQGLKTQLDAAGTDKIALKAITDDLGSHADAWAAAIAANTNTPTPGPDSQAA